jgi:hypothetical protein
MDVRASRAPDNGIPLEGNLETLDFLRINIHQQQQRGGLSEGADEP